MTESGEKFKDLTIIVPVREGSSRIKKKVLQPFGEQMNLLEWKIAQLKEVHDNILISSNSENIKKIAQNMGVGYHQRDDYLCEGHQASFSEVITGIVKDIETDHFAWVTVVVPLMAPVEYEQGFDMYFEEIVEKGSHDSLFSAN